MTTIYKAQLSRGNQRIDRDVRFEGVHKARVAGMATSYIEEASREAASIGWPDLPAVTVRVLPIPASR
jgi:hypothetical protein